MNALIYLLAAILCGVFAVRSRRSAPGEPGRRALAALAALASVTWAAFSLHLMPGMADLRLLYMAAGATLPLATLHLLQTHLGPATGAPDALAAARPAAVAIAALVLIDALTAEGGPGPAGGLLALLTLAGFALCLRALWRVHQESPHRVDRMRVRYLAGLLATAVGAHAAEQALRWLGPLPDGPWGPALQGTLPPLGAALGTFVIYVLSRIVAHSRLLDLTEIFARVATLTASALLWVAAAAALSAGADPLHGAFGLFLGSALFLGVHPELERRLDALIGAALNRRGRALTQTLSAIDRELARVISLSALDDTLLERLHASGRVPQCSLYLWDAGVFRLRLSRGTKVAALVSPITDATFARTLLGGPHVRAALTRNGGDEMTAQTLRTLDAMSADVCLPLRGAGRVLGWINIQHEAWSDGFSDREIRRLMETADRVAIVVENIGSVRALGEQRRLAMLGTMAAALAHEIRNPLAGIRGAAQVLDDPAEPEEPDTQREFLGVIVEEADRLNRVVSQFLDFARPLTLSCEPADPNAVIERTLTLAPEVTTELDRDLPLVPLDADRLRQILLNLIQNAHQANPPDGTITVRTGRGRLTGGEQALEIAVIDDGPGIAPDAQARLFEPFTTTRDDGTGLGLPISRRLAQAHGGELVVERAEGRGAMFVVRLPLSER